MGKRIVKANLPEQEGEYSIVLDKLSKFLYNDNNILYFAGHIWVSKEAREEGFAPIDKFEDSFELDELPEENLLRFTYRHIQETASAEDVMTMHPKYKGFIDSTFIQD